MSKLSDFDNDRILHWYSFSLMRGGSFAPIGGDRSYSSDELRQELLRRDIYPETRPLLHLLDQEFEEFRAVKDDVSFAWAMNAISELGLREDKLGQILDGIATNRNRKGCDRWLREPLEHMLSRFTVEYRAEISSWKLCERHGHLRPLIHPPTRFVCLLCRTMLDIAPGHLDPFVSHQDRA